MQRTQSESDGTGTSRKLPRDHVSTRPPKHYSDVRGHMIDYDLLKRAFKEFDRSGKGYITEADLARVLGGRVGGEQFGSWLAGGSSADREGYRVTYGSYLQLMTNVTSISPVELTPLIAPDCRQVPLMSATEWLAHQVLKQTVEPGNFIFRQGDPADYFYCIISGEVEIVRLHLG